MTARRCDYTLLCEGMSDQCLDDLVESLVGLSEEGDMSAKHRLAIASRVAGDRARKELVRQLRGTSTYAEIST